MYLIKIMHPWAITDNQFSDPPYILMILISSSAGAVINYTVKAFTLFTYLTRSVWIEGPYWFPLATDELALFQSPG